MDNLTTEYVSRGTTWLFITTLTYFFMNGAQLFETAAVVPKFTASPPESFHLFKGPYGLDFKAFWITLHSVHEVTFILALVFCWKLDPIRNWLLLLFAIHVAVRVWTIAYFAPNIIDFQHIANTTNHGTDLLARASRWRILNYVRVAMFMAVSLGLIPVCIRIAQLRFKV